MLYSVITTIAEPTQCVRELCAMLGRSDSTLIAVGDKKGPSRFEVANSEFLSLEAQLQLPFALVKDLPTGHYTRKNLGYLQAMAKGADCIYETDDDNAPLPHWRIRAEIVESAAEVAADSGWVNVYKYFSEENIWPRGLPLDEIIKPRPGKNSVSGIRTPIQQGLVNNAPDVDAIWRLVMDRPFEFEAGESILVPAGVWCPFNTQSTWWFPAAYPLMYIPSYCSFRMCDIWKSFVAQRCLWALGFGVVFHAPEVYQDRNAHNLVKDFTDEIPGYTGNRKIAEILDSLTLQTGEENTLKNLFRCYEALVRGGFFPEKELDLVKCWIADVKNILK